MYEAIASNRNKSLLVMSLFVIFIVGLGYIFRPSSGTVAGVQTNTPSVPSQTTGSLQGTVQAPTY